MLDSNYRSKVQPIMNTLAKPLIKLNVSPNGISLMGFLIGLSAAGAIFLGKDWLALALLWASGILDVLDGTVARLTNKTSSFGAYMDMIFDRIVEIAFVISIYLVRPDLALVVIIFLSAVIFNFSTFTLAGALVENKGVKSMHYDPGIAERTETFITFTIIIIFRDQTNYILGFFNMLIVLTGVIRSVSLYRLSKLKKI